MSPLRRRKGCQKILRYGDQVRGELHSGMASKVADAEDLQYGA